MPVAAPCWKTSTSTPYAALTETRLRITAERGHGPPLRSDRVRRERAAGAAGVDDDLVRRERARADARLEQVQAFRRLRAARRPAVVAARQVQLERRHRECDQHREGA